MKLQLKSILTLFILLNLFFTLNTFAAEQRLVKIANDFNDTYVEFYLNLDEFENIIHLRYVIADQKKIDENEIFSIVDFQKGDVFKKGLFKKYVKMNAPKFDSHSGGIIYMSFPKTILSSKKINLKFNLVKNNDGWSLNNQQVINIKTVLAKVRRKLGIPFGIGPILFTR